MKSLARVFIIALTFTVTNKIDKDKEMQGMDSSLNGNNTSAFVRPRKSSTIFETPTLDDKFIRSS